MDIFKNVFSKIIHFPYSCFGLKQWGTFYEYSYEDSHIEKYGL